MKIITTSLSKTTCDSVLNKNIVENLLKIALKNNSVSDFEIETISVKKLNENIEDIVKEYDAIYFIGGNLFNLHDYFYYEYLDFVTLIADENNIPIFFISTEFDKNDSIGNEVLEKILKRKCVKLVSVNANNQIEKEYLKKGSYNIVKTCNPGVWTKYVYAKEILEDDDIEIEEPKEKIIGINVINDQVFEENDIKWTFKQEMKYLNDLINLIENSEYDYRLYTNGRVFDNNYLKTFIKKYKIPNEKVIMIQSEKKLVKSIKSFDFVVAFSVNSSIISYSLGIPVINLAINEEITNFYKLINEEENVIQLKDWNAFNIFNIICKKINKKENNTDIEFLMSLYDSLYDSINKNLKDNSTTKYNFKKIVNLLETRYVDYKIDNIYWERANLHIVLNENIKEKVYLKFKKKKILLNTQDKEIIISVYNTPEGKMLSANSYRLFINDSEIYLDTSLLSLLDDKSRIFTYRKERYAYLVTLSSTSDFKLKIITRFMMINRHPKKFYRLIEAKSKKGMVSILFKRFLIWSANLFYKILHLFCSKKTTILFLTENDDELRSNLKYFYEYMINFNYKIRVFADNKFKGQKNSLKFIKEIVYIALSNIIIVDNYTPILTHLKLNKNTKLIQLWHAGVGFKSVGYARFGLKGSPHPYKSCHRNYTHAIVDNEKLIDVYKEVFGIKNAKFYPFGMPRLDNYLNKENILNKANDLYKLNPDLKTNKIIMFSPTYRGLGSKSAYYDYDKLNLEEIYKFCDKNNFIFIIKMHPFIKERLEIEEKYANRIYDYSDFDINDLIYISDIMITDYSSCAYEFSLFNRPLIFYRYDKELYEHDRPVHTIDAFTKKQYEVKTFEELMNILNELKDEIPKDRFDKVKWETKKSCELIKNEIIDENKKEI